MTWDPSIFFQAFSAAGMLKSADVTMLDGSQVLGVQVGLETPDEVVLGGRVITAAVVMEFETAALPALKEKCTVVIDGITYRLREDPRRKGDGYFSQALLNT